MVSEEKLIILGDIVNFALSKKLVCPCQHNFNESEFRIVTYLSKCYFIVNHLNDTEDHWAMLALHGEWFDNHSKYTNEDVLFKTAGQIVAVLKKIAKPEEEW